MGIELHYLNTGKLDEPTKGLKAMTRGKGFDDVFVMAPVKPVVEQADLLLAKDGCMNFFAGPTQKDFTAAVNFYDIHYAFYHIVGTSGGNTEDMRISLRLMEEGRINPQVMITHLGGLDAMAETTLNLPKISGGEKLIYVHKRCPLTPIEDFAEKVKTDPLFAGLAEITTAHKGFWSREAEEYFLEHAEDIGGFDHPLIG